jgi:Domain of unknown function (DUF4114)
MPSIYPFSLAVVPSPKQRGQKLDRTNIGFLGANSDTADRIRLLGDNTFKFEDLVGGGDRDFNDIIIDITLVSRSSPDRGTPLSIENSAVG